MKSFLEAREVVLRKFYEEFHREYPLELLVQATQEVLETVCRQKYSSADIQESLHSILSKTETYNTLLTLQELEKRSLMDVDLQKAMEDPSYNQHRAVASNICDMYSAGASSFYGYVDCMFSTYFPSKRSRSFLAKGACALVGSAAETMMTSHVEEDYTDRNIRLLSDRGVELGDMTCLVYDLQKPYNATLTMDECERHIYGVLRKQQTYHTIQLCVLIDTGVENHEFGEQFHEIVKNDEGLYGLDETVNVSVSKMYGMIAITNFGYLDKAKPGVIGALDSVKEGQCNTYMDDTVCAIVSAACARLAHNNVHTNSKPKQ